VLPDAACVFTGQYGTSNTVHNLNVVILETLNFSEGRTGYLVGRAQLDLNTLLKLAFTQQAISHLLRSRLLHVHQHEKQDMIHAGIKNGTDFIRETAGKVRRKVTTGLRPTRRANSLQAGANERRGVTHTFAA